MEALTSPLKSIGCCPVFFNIQRILGDKAVINPCLIKGQSPGNIKPSIIQKGQLRIRLLYTYEGVLAVNEPAADYYQG